MKLEEIEDVIVNHLDRVGEEVTECTYLVYSSAEPNMKYGTDKIKIDNSNDLIDYITMRNTGLSKKEVINKNIIEKPILLIDDLDTALEHEYPYLIVN